MLHHKVNCSSAHFITLGLKLIKVTHKRHTVRCKNTMILYFKEQLVNPGAFIILGCYAAHVGNCLPTFLACVKLFRKINNSGNDHERVRKCEHYRPRIH